MPTIIEFSKNNRRHGVQILGLFGVFALEKTTISTVVFRIFLDFPFCFFLVVLRVDLGVSPCHFCAGATEAIFLLSIGQEV